MSLGSITGPPAFKRFLWAAIIFSSSSQADPDRVFITAYAADTIPGIIHEVRVSVSEQPLDPVQLRPVDPARLLLILMDPGSVTRAEAGAFLSAVASNLAGRRPMPTCRLGIAVLDGILLDPISDPEDLKAGFDRAVRGYFPERTQAGNSAPGRFFDLVVRLLEAAQEQHGPLDCIILARDHTPGDEESDYVSEALERKLLGTVLDAGTTVYGYLEGSGIWHDLCRASGGHVFRREFSASAVIAGILERRTRGLLIEGRIPIEALGNGRHCLRLTAQRSDGAHLSLEGPGSIWIGPGLGEPPSYYGVRQGLDWRRRSGEAEKDGNDTVALRYMENSIQEDPWNHRSHYDAGRLAAACGDLAQASAYLGGAVGFVAADEPTLSLYASVQEKRGLAETALETIRSRKAPFDGAARKVSARLLARLARPGEAAALFADLARENPRDDEVQGEYGRVLHKLGDGAGSLEQFELSQRLNPGAFHALLGLSEIALSRGDLEAAGTWARKSLAARPDDPDALLHSARVLIAGRKHVEAGSTLRRAYDRYPYRHDVLAALADAEAAAGRIDEAKRLLIGALANYPRSGQIYQALAQVYRSAGDAASSASVLEAGAAAVSRQAPAFYEEAARRRERHGEYGQALLDYRALQDSAPPETAGVVQERIRDHVTYLALRMGGKPEDIVRPAGAASAPSEEVKNAPLLPAGADRKPAAGLIVPGGIELLSRTVGLEAENLRAPDALCRLFAFVLGTSSVTGSRSLQDHPVREEAVTYLRNYSRLLRYLDAEGIRPAGERADRIQPLAIKLAGARPERETAERFLKFFGVKYRLREGKSGRSEILFVLKSGRANEARQRLLRNLGVNLHGTAAMEIRIPMTDARLPLLFDTAIWKDKILGKPEIPDEALLENMLLDPDVMRLYLALQECSERTRAALLEASAPGELRAMTHAIRLFGPFLDVREDRVVFPGSSESWRAFLGARPEEGAAALAGRLLRQNRGRALGLYYFLSLAEESTRSYFTSSPSALSMLHSLLPPLSAKSDTDLDELSYRNLGRLARLMRADKEGPFLMLDPRFHRLVSGSPAEHTAGQDKQRPRLHLSMDSLSALVQRLSKPGTGTRSIVEELEYLSYVQSESAVLLEESAIGAVLEDPGQYPVLMNLLWSLQLPADLAARYLKYCRRIAGMGARGWNENRTRTTQALFYLLHCLRRGGAIDREEVESLVPDLLAELEAGDEDETAFAFRAASFLSLRLLTTLKNRIAGDWDPSELLWRALAGPAAGFKLVHQGSTVEGDLRTYRLGRMKAAVQHQNFIPLSDLLRLLELLRAIPGDAGAAASIFADRLGQISKLQTAPGLERSSRKAAQADIDALEQSWLAFTARRGRSQAPPAGLIRDTAAALHLELGVTLLTYCYAFEKSPEADPLVFDPNFIRRHSFYPRSVRGWAAARVQGGRDSGLYVEGSLSGLGSMLDTSRREWRPGTLAALKGATPVPIQWSSQNNIPSTDPSERAQEYVALTSRLGKEILILSAVDAQLLEWCEKVLGELLLPGRMEPLLRDLKARDALHTLQRLTASEFFLLGNAYISVIIMGAGVGQAPVSYFRQGPDRAGEGNSPAAPPAISCPILERLVEILPKNGGAEYGRFQKEVALYGIHLGERTVWDWSPAAVQKPPGQTGVAIAEISDLRIQLAELGYSLEWPAAFAVMAEEVSLQDILPRRGDEQSGNWKMRMGRIASLSPADARRWVEQCLDLGYLRRPEPEEAQRP